MISTQQSFVRRVSLPVPAEFAFRWHAQPGALERLTPPWESVRIVSPAEGIQDGAKAVFEVRLGPGVRRRWVAEHRHYIEGRQFQDVQRDGPFARWEHTHTFFPNGGGCDLEDRIEYALPLGFVGTIVAGRTVRGKLERMFRYRHEVTRRDLRAHWQYREQPRMNVLISGSTGLLGSALIPFLTGGGHEIRRLVRSTPKDKSEIQWDTHSGVRDPAALEGIDAVVHLAGESIARRWTAERKRRIRDSRVEGTRRLCEALAALRNPPKVLVAGSAIGYYGHRGDEILTEESLPGEGFLAEVCQAWEAATAPAKDRGLRVVNLRTGVVLSPKGGALAKTLPLFRFGLGGKIGSGRQYWSWIALDDEIGAIHHCLMNDQLSGPVNATAPHPVTNAEFTQTLGRVLHRPTVFPAPAFTLKTVLGEMADEMLLASARVLPRRLQESGYEFRYPTLDAALRHLLGR